MSEEENERDFMKACFNVVAGLEVKNENQQLKDENDYYFKKNIELSTLNTSLRSDRDLYKEVIEEVREYIKRHIRPEYRNGRDNEFYLELNEKELKELSQIFGKVKDKENKKIKIGQVVSLEEIDEYFICDNEKLWEDLWEE